MSDTQIAAPPGAVVPPPQPLAPAPATAPDAFAPVIDVGTSAPSQVPGEPGSGLAPVFFGPGAAPHIAPGDDKVRHDFLASRALAEAGDPWSRLNALISGQQPSQGAPKQRGGTDTAPGTGGASRGPQGAPDDDRPAGTRLVDAPLGLDRGQGSDITEPGAELSLDALVAPVGRAAKDIGIGGLETPQAALRGMLGAVQQGAGGAVSVIDAIDGLLPKWLTTSPMQAEFEKAGYAGGNMQDVLRKLSEGAGWVRDALPEESTATGNLIEQATQFGAGLPLGKSLAGAAGLSGVGQHLAADAVAGATTMDSNAPRLSNLIDDIAPNFLTDWLKAKPGEDGQLMGRLKSGLEFAGLGALFEGLKAGLGVIKRAATTPREGFGSESAASRRNPPGAPQTTEMPNPANRPAGQATGDVLPPELQPAPLVTITPKTVGMAQTVLEQQQGMERLPPGEAGAPAGLSAEEVADYIAGREADNPIRLNLLRIGSGEDIQNALEEVARTIPEPEVVSNEATIRASDALGVSPSDFLSGYAGQNLNASQTTAMRFMLDSSAAQLIDYAKTASNPLANSDEARATFMRAFATHRALQEYFVNARAEAGRTLQAWSIMSQQRAGYTQAVQQLIEQGGKDNIDQMAAQIADLDNPLQVSRLVAASERGTGRDTFLKTYYNVLLSNPRTVVKKLASDGTMVMWNMATNYAAEIGGSGAVPSGETAALGYGYLSSLKDAIRIAGKGLKAGESQFFKQFQTMDWGDKSRLSLLANGAPELIPADAPTQAGASWLRAALPTSWIGAADDFAKYLNYKAYLNALAYRDGVSRGLEGQDLATHVAQTLDNVPDALHQQALTQALRSTFQEPLTGVLAKFQDIADSLNVPVAHTNFEIPFGRIIMPFIKVPANIMRWSYNNTALNRLFPSENIRAEMNAGGASRDLAMARTWLGSAVALGFADMALNNTVTGAGPKDPKLQAAWRDAGNRPYSVQLPGMRPVSYNMVEPIGMLIGAIADSFNVMRFAKQDDRENLAAAVAFGVGHAVLSKTYMQGVANVFDALADPERTGDRVAQSMALAFVSPQGIAAAAHALDPYIRAHRTFMENIESRLPFVSERLPPALTALGEPVPQSDAYLPFMPTDNFVPRLLSPWQLGSRGEDVPPISRWLWDNRTALAHSVAGTEDGESVVHVTGPGGAGAISKPRDTVVFGRGDAAVPYRLDPVQYYRYQVLAGNELKDPANGLGARDLLNGLVTGTSAATGMQDTWNQATTGARAVIVQRIINAYRNAAKDALRSEFPEIEEGVRSAAQNRAIQLQGAH